MANTVAKGAQTTKTFNTKATKEAPQDDATPKTPTVGEGTTADDTNATPQSQGEGTTAEGQGTTAEVVQQTPQEGIELESAYGFERTLIGDYIVERPLRAVVEAEPLDKKAVITSEEDDLQK